MSEAEAKRGAGREIWVNAFTEESAQLFRDQVFERADRDGTNVIPVYIDSYGGQVDALAKMLDTMDEVPNRFVTVCMGKAMSCGAILLSHGDLRFVSAHSRVMVHNVSAGVIGDVTEMQSNTEEAQRINEVFIGLLAKNCKMSYKDLQDKIKESTDSKNIYLSPEDALKFGIVDKIGVPELVPIVQFAVDVVQKKQRLNFDGDGVAKTTKPKTKTATKTVTKSKKPKR